MGRQPALDGIRTFSVGMVAIHHVEIIHRQIFGEASHHEIVTGGFVFPEMFFVMSGFLITTIMLQERESTGRFSVKGFYARRARRLLPGLWVMMAGAILWATFFGYIHLEGHASAHRYHLSELRWSSLFTVLMSQNWYMIFSGNGYFGGFPDLFRHIWSLSIDEQFYILFPLLLVGMYGFGKKLDTRRLLKVIAPIAVIGWIVMAWQYKAPTVIDQFHVNFTYLSTITRIPGILVGVALACVWQPWKWPNAKRGHLPWLDVVGLGSFALIMIIGVTAHNEAWYVYRGLFPVVSLLAAAVAAMCVHPGARYTRAFFGNKVISGIGQRAFGIYLWHWPIFAGPLATKPLTTKFLIGVPLTALFAELSYRFIENPFRERAIGKWRAKVREAKGLRRQELVRPVAIAGAGCIFLVGALTLRVATAPHADLISDGGIDDLADGTATPAITDPIDAGGTTVAVTDGSGDTVDGTVDGTVDDTGGATDDTLPAGQDEPATTVPAVATSAVAPQTGKIRMAIVGSSQAVALGRNLPSSAKEIFKTAEGGKSGCTVFSDGIMEGHRMDDDGDKLDKLMKWDFGVACKNWLSSWTKAAKAVDAEIALVVTGGWEVFDLVFPDHRLVFGTPEFDDYYIQNMQIGIDAMKKLGAKVAFLEPPCQRPFDTPQAGVPPLWERRQDERAHHIGDLMEKMAKADPQNVFFIENSPAWCNDPSIGDNPAYRFDGVHVLGKGAKLIMDTITPDLLKIPLAGR